jgi:hypothetical protein
MEIICPRSVDLLWSTKFSDPNGDGAKHFLTLPYRWKLAAYQRIQVTERFVFFPVRPRSVNLVVPCKISNQIFRGRCSWQESEILVNAV